MSRFDEEKEEGGVEKVGLLFVEIDDGVYWADTKNGENKNGVEPA